jgi:hypothetical protein
MQLSKIILMPKELFEMKCQSFRLLLYSKPKGYLTKLSHHVISQAKIIFFMPTSFIIERLHRDKKKLSLFMA